MFSYTRYQLYGLPQAPPTLYALLQAIQPGPD